MEEEDLRGADLLMPSLQLSLHRLLLQLLEEARVGSNLSRE